MPRGLLLLKLKSKLMHRKWLRLRLIRNWRLKGLPRWRRIKEKLRGLLKLKPIKRQRQKDWQNLRQIKRQKLKDWQNLRQIKRLKPRDWPN